MCRQRAGGTDNPGMNPAIPANAEHPLVAVVGAGPAGLRAAEILAAAGLQVDVFDAMPSAGRKFLLAGRGGLNLTHSEPAAPFLARYGDRAVRLAAPVAAFDAQALRDWAEGLGVETFVGTSGRVFPRDLKAAPLLRAWLHRLRGLGVRFHMRHRWVGFGERGAPGVALRFQGPAGGVRVQAAACVLALGGASWARLGSDGTWLPWLREAGVGVSALRPSNCGFEVARPQGDGSLVPGWTAFFSEHHAGSPLKNVAISLPSTQGVAAFAQRGEFVVTQSGVEGSLVYAASAALRDGIERSGRAVFLLDLLPMHGAGHVAAEVARPRGSRSLSTHLKARLGLDGVKAALLRELLTKAQLADPAQLAQSIKALPVTVVAPRPIDEAISSAGGVRFDAMDERFMLTALPGVFCAGEMLDWEAPTGGYLLTACMATGGWAARGVVEYLKQPSSTGS